MYAVYGNGKPAILKRSAIWNKYKYDSLKDAIAYAHSWLSPVFSPGKANLKKLAIGKSYDYDGCGDTIEIRKEK